MSTQTASSWKIAQTDAMVHRLDLAPFSRVGEERWVLLMADEHFDNAHSDLDLIRKHHEQARERNAPVLKIGDLFCAMQGKWDPRADQDQLRPELRGNHYLDKLKDYAESIYAPFAEQIALVSPGNHETNISKRHQTSLTQCFVDRLRRSGSQAVIGGYTGFVRIGLKHGTRQRSSLLHYHHGFGGGGEVTRGMIDFNRIRGQYSADVYIAGHIHRRNLDQNEIIVVNGMGNAEVKTQWFLRSGAYKHEHGPNGWHVEGGRAARPAGGWWLRFTMRCTKTDTIWDVTPIPA